VFVTRAFDDQRGNVPEPDILPRMRPAPCFAPLKSAVVEPYIVTRVLRIKYRRELKTRRSSNLKRRAWGRGRHPVQPERRGLEK
jgi:hypothetical protein